MPKNIVVLGGGFGGVYTALNLLKQLKKDEARVILISKTNYFLFAPMLHEVATGNIKRENVVEPIRDIIQGENFEFHKAIVEKINLKKKSVKVDCGNFSYDQLVIALGSTSNFFGLSGSEHCLTLKSLHDAYHLRNQIIDMFEKAAVTKDIKKKKQMLTFVIVGGGPTGVELACEISDWVHQNCKSYTGVCEFNDVNLILLDTNDKVLRGVDEKLRSNAMKVLKKKKIEVLSGALAKEVTPNNVSYEVDKKMKTLDTNTVIWTAGVKPVDINIVGIEKERGTLPVDENLNIKGYKNAFAIGDIASFVNPDGSRPPPTAQLAHRASFDAAKNIVANIRKEKLTPFVFHSSGFLASLGKWRAIAIINGVRLYGFPAWFIWRTIYLSKLVGIQNKIRVAIDWTFDFFGKRDTSQV